MSGLVPGEVYFYNYLWRREQLSGEESGRKARPAVLIFRSATDPARLFLFPITTQRPDASREAIDIPKSERDRCGLGQPCWLIIDEFNITLDTRSYDFASLTPLGRLSDRFYATLARRIASVIRAGAAKHVKRS